MTHAEMDNLLTSIFAGARPDAGLEDRLVAGFRGTRPALVIHPMVRKAAIGVAAAILLGGAGFAVMHAENYGKNGIRSAINQQHSVAISANENNGEFQRHHEQTFVKSSSEISTRAFE